MKYLLLVLFITSSLLAKDMKCNENGNQLELNQCAHEKFKETDKKLNTVYNKLRVKHKNDKLYLKNLKTSQKIWLKFLEAELNTIYSCDDKNIKVCFGSMFPLLYSNSKTELTENRTRQLEKYFVNPLTSENDKSSTTCYQHTLGKDFTVIELTQTSDDITGYYAWVPFEKDSARGSFKGTVKNNIIKGNFIYSIEGSTQEEEVVFKMQKNALIQGRGELVDSKFNGKLQLKNPSKVTWEDSFKKVECSTITEEIVYAQEVANMITKERKK